MAGLMLEARLPLRLVVLITCLCVAALLVGDPRASRAQECSAATLVRIQADARVSPDDIEAIRRGFELADEFFKEVLGRTVCTRIAVRVVGGVLPEGLAGVYGRDLIQVGAGDPRWTGLAPIVKSKIMVHEYFHILQNELSQEYGGPADEVRASGPTWLREGSAELVAWKAVVDVAFGTVRARFIESTRRNPATTLRRMETLQGFQQARGGLDVSVIALEHLVGEKLDGLVTYYARTSRTPWANAFREIFGKGVPEFYQSFEEYRRTL